MQLVLSDIEGSGEVYLKIMKAICGDTSEKSMVDLGAHSAPYTSQLGFKERTYVDIQDRGLDFKDEEKFFVKSDMVSFLRRGNHYDCAISSDSLEHIPLPKGRVMVYLMERYSYKQIIFTPLGGVWLGEERVNRPDMHKSAWSPGYFEGWAKIIMPNFHPTINMGAFFTWHCENIEEDFLRVKNELVL